MPNYFYVLKDFLKNEDGPTAVEYAVVVALVIIVCMGAISVFGQAVAAWFNDAPPTVNALPTA